LATAQLLSAVVEAAATADQDRTGAQQVKVIVFNSSNIIIVLFVYYFIG
jgi:hypothetical protein